MYKFDNAFFNSLIAAIVILLVIDYTTGVNDKSSDVDEQSDSAYIDRGKQLALPSKKPDFKAIPAGKERKKAFFNYFLPIVEFRNNQLLALREEVVELYEKRTQLTSEQIAHVESIANEYDIEGFSVSNEQNWQTLIRRIDVVPPSLALAQAANESAWGTSRFALQGNNFFGQWCFRKGCGLVPKSRGEGQVHEVAKFNSPQQSVFRYMHNLNTHEAYRQLRGLREKLRNQQQSITGIKLASGLEKYSERGHEYIEELRQMIRFNKLDRLDS
ncbi:glucosaminidase domain-containing protein [Catenovulum sp. SX2]|uniref:glucosaminidase domain-containing protein n=1 Tax=Catenovulum sp. SX2 TaxID=3398614 RepID=UPI003F83D26C